MLGWQLKDIIPLLDKIKSQNFDAIQINPIQPCKENVKNVWWMSYQPISFEIGNEFGSKSDLITLCYIAKTKGIDIIADVVCNHLANKNYANSLEPNEKCDAELVSNPSCWKGKNLISDYSHRADVIKNNIGLPGLNHNNEIVQSKIIKFLSDLRDCGVSGFRFDAAKHIALPEEGCNFWNLIKCFLYLNNMYAYGEVLGNNYFIAEAYSNYFDILTEYGNEVPPNKAMIFPETHDQYLHEEETYYASDEEIARRYLEICKENLKTGYYMRPNDLFALSSPEIKQSNSYKNENTKVLRKVI